MSGVIEDGPFSPANILRIRSFKPGPPPTTATPGYVVEITTASLITPLLSGLRGTRGPVPSNSGPRPQTFVWVPAPILEYGVPGLVGMYYSKQTKKQTTVSQWVDVSDFSD